MERHVCVFAIFAVPLQAKTNNADPLCPSDISPSSPCGGLRGDKSVLLPLALPQGRGGEPSGWLSRDLPPHKGGGLGERVWELDYYESTDTDKE